MSKKPSYSKINASGVIWFFALIAIVMQIAILVYDFIRQKTDNVLLIAFLILNMIVIVSLLCTTFDYIRRKIMIEKPTQKILDATKKIANGDFSVRIDIEKEYSKYNQYDMIMENINVLSAELQKNEVLKNDFISNVSHEIKTPLAVIKNYSSLLLSEGIDEKEKQKYAEIIKNATNRITDLISDVLKLNKLENQEIKVQKEKFNLTSALEECVLNFEDKIEKKEIELNCDFEDINIKNSKSMLDTVWTNLISNAIKFTNIGGKIDVTLKKVGKNVEVKVKDNGIGMNKETGDRIFEKFYQGDTSHSSEGNGLGLPLVKKIIDLLGGTISVSSEVNKGTEFTVVIRDEG